MGQLAIDLFMEIGIPAFQIALVFGFCSYLVRKFLDMAFNGRIKL